MKTWVFSSQLLGPIYYSWQLHYKNTCLWHLRLAVSSKECQVVNFILHHKILLFPFKVLWTKSRNNFWKSWNICRSLKLFFGAIQRTYMRFTPKDENLWHHFEKFIWIWIWFLQPFRSRLSKERWSLFWKADILFSLYSRNMTFFLINM